MRHTCVVCVFVCVFGIDWGARFLEWTDAKTYPTQNYHFEIMMPFF